MIVDINWNEDMFIWQYNRGLNKEVKDQLFNFPIQTSLDALIELSIHINNQLYQQKMERQEDHHPIPAPRPQPKPQVLQPPPPPSNAPNAFAHSAPVPIHVDANSRGPPQPKKRNEEGTLTFATTVERCKVD
ncbi:hypothetical protein FRC01_005389 [Tulasnella sp. 417]|nr:hypothetical protein FRC01_005389 [Tulasnella sp. 417]